MSDVVEYGTEAGTSHAAAHGAPALPEQSATLPEETPVLSEEQKWWAVSGAAAVGAVVGTRFVLRQGWQAATRRKPPENPVLPRVGWGEAMTWAVVTGVTASLARLVAQRASASAWRHVTGRYPRALRRRRVRP